MGFFDKLLFPGKEGAMGLACKITGHKWNKLPDGSDGCTCTRCGERRNEGHDWHFTREREDWIFSSRHVIAGRFYVCSVCGHWETERVRQEHCTHDWDSCRCRLCGLTRDEGHDWNGCKCARCGEVRNEGHDWQKAVANFGAKEHRRQCRICGRYETERHSFKHLPDCRHRCTVCGYTMTWHEFMDGTCVACGIDESDYYCELILSGKVEYGEHEYSPVDGSSRKYGSHVNSVPALLRIAMAGEKKGLYDSYKVDCANKIIAIARKGGAETREANLALREIALNGTPHSRLPAAKGINDPEIASDPEVIEAIERMEEADRRYENAMIASDSGLYTTG